MMKSIRINKTFIYTDIITSVSVLIVLVCFMVTQSDSLSIIMIVSGIMMIPLSYHFATLLKCYRYDRHATITIYDNIFHYSNDNAIITFDIEEVSDYIVYISSRIGHDYSVLKLKNNQCIYITDLMDSTICSKLFGLKAKVDYDVFLVNLPKRPLIDTLV